MYGNILYIICVLEVVMNYRKKGLWLLAPGLAGFIMFYIAPFVYSLYYALIENTFTRKFVGFANFIDVISNKYYRIALKNTFQFTGIGVPILVLLSLILAILLVSGKGKSHLYRAAF